jgi:hypothetical protein
MLGKGEMFAEPVSGESAGTGKELDIKNRNFQNLEAVNELLDYMEKSQLVEYSILYSFRVLLLKDRESIQAEINGFEKEKKGE